MIDSLVRDIELYLDMNDLAQLGLSEEEILGFVSFYLESWDLAVSMEYE